MKSYCCKANIALGANGYSCTECGESLISGLLATPSETRIAEFTRMVAAHDLFYEFADDGYAYARGCREKSDIREYAERHLPKRVAAQIWNERIRRCEAPDRMLWEEEARVRPPEVKAPARWARILPPERYNKLWRYMVGRADGSTERGYFHTEEAVKSYLGGI